MPQVLLHRPPKSRAVRSNNFSSSPPSARQPQSSNHGKNRFSLALWGRWVGSVSQGLLGKSETLFPLQLLWWRQPYALLAWLSFVCPKSWSWPPPQCGVQEPSKNCAQGAAGPWGRTKAAWKGFLLPEPFRAASSPAVGKERVWGKGKRSWVLPLSPRVCANRVRVARRGPLPPRVFPQTRRRGVAPKDEGSVGRAGRRGGGTAGDKAEPGVSRGGKRIFPRCFFGILERYRILTGKSG